MLGGSQDEVAVGDGAVVALQIDGAGCGFVAIQGAAGNAGNLAVTNDGAAILNDGDIAAEEGDIEGLPLAGAARLFGFGGEETIDGAHVVAGRLGEGVVLDLHFVAAAQIDAAVGIFGAVDFDVELEIGKDGGGDEVGAGLGIDEGSVLDAPPGFGGMIETPAGKVGAIEKGLGRAPMRMGGPRKRRSGETDPGPFGLIRADGMAVEQAAGDEAIENEVIGAAFFVLGRDEEDVTARHFNFGEFAGVAPAPDETGMGGVVGKGDLEPRGESGAIGGLDGQIPASSEGRWRAV